MKRKIATLLAAVALTMACATIGGTLVGAGIGAIAGDAQMGAAVGATAGAVVDIWGRWGARGAYVGRQLGPLGPVGIDPRVYTCARFLGQAESSAQRGAARISCNMTSPRFSPTAMRFGRSAPAALRNASAQDELMDALSRVLIVDDSKVLREMLRLVFNPHCEEILTASGVREGIETLVQNQNISLVISDVIMPDGGGFELLRHVSSLDAPRPKVILLTARLMEEDERRATEMGAIGYLAKPTSFREISRVLRRSQAGSGYAERRKRRRTLGRAFLADPARQELSHLVFEIHDLSRAGAFLVTNSPLPIGTELHLSLVLGDATARVRAEVIRVQEPSWGRMGGVGVVFRDFDEGAREIFETYVAEGINEIY